MKIKSIKAENFRNFKDETYFEFPTDGRLSVIYGTNGAGKTTFHQLIQWVIYGKVNFNKTASDIKYNLQTARDACIDDVFKVVGQIEFEHPNEFGVIENYCIYRDQIYKKISDTKIELRLENFEITKKHIDGKKEDWHKISGNPNDVINMILPQGLSPYFFFDGETMIADIKSTGSSSAKAIKNALYSIFDLDIYEHAITHIGALDISGKAYLPSTVLGKLNAERVRNVTDGRLMILKGDLNRAEKLAEEAKEKLETQLRIITKKQAEIAELSEKIGSAKDAASLNRTRKQKVESIQLFEESIRKEKLAFGKSIFDNYTYLFLAAVAKDAKNRIALKVGEEHLIEGVTKPLIDALLQEERCVCGHTIGAEERKYLSEYFNKLPPKSYKYMYDLFQHETLRWAKTYKPGLLVNHLESIFKYLELIESTRSEINDIDKELKISTGKAKLIEDRKKAEAALAHHSSTKSTCELELKIKESNLKKASKAYKEALDSMEQNQDVLTRIYVMEAVLKHFTEKVELVKNTYSKKLQSNIQLILNTTLNCDRYVYMSNEFAFSVKDEFGKEDKSEGQFAMVSFAYICGIFKLLLEDDLLINKQYPLVLDGPFSKLDVINRQNIINELPNYAPQVIIFSKDDLSDALNGDEEIWTLFPNAGKNVTKVEYGYFPEVFEK